MSAPGAVAIPISSARLARLRPYAFHLVLASYLPVLLWLDARVASPEQQHLLGVATGALLAVALLFSGWHERRVVLLAVAFWACVEVLGSIVWGIYGYRFGNLPLYVPFGHGLVYLFGLRALRTPLAARHGRLLARGCALAASAWALAGLTLLPALGGRLDVAGALLAPIFVWGILRSPRATFYAAVFVATSALELLGTGLGTWTWAETQPLTQIPQGNPPSVIAGAYCIWDAVLGRLWARGARLLVPGRGSWLRRRHGAPDPS